jgi:hypothetical protein
MLCARLAASSSPGTLPGVFLSFLHAAAPGLNPLASAPWLVLALGAALLLAGRQLFWLFVAAVGFFAALHFAQGVLGDEHRDWALIASLLAGAVGAGLAVIVQKFAVALAGAVTGGYLLDQFFRSTLEQYPTFGWLFVALAAVLGALLMVKLFRWALIVVTSLAGAHLLLAMVEWPPRWLALAYAALFVTGVAWQSSGGRRRPEAK